MTNLSRRLIAVLCLAALLALGSCTRGDSEEQRPHEPIVPIRVEQLRSFTFEDQVQATGQWRSKADLIVAAPFAGVLGAVLARAGDALRAGATIGTMTTLESHATLKGAELLLREARDPSARAEAERAVAQARHDLVQVPIAVTESGIIVRRSAEPGAQLAEGAEILALAPWTGFVFEAHVPAGQGPSVHPGQRALIQEEGRPARAARVERILPAADPTDQTTLVWLAPTTLSPAPQLQHFGSTSITIGAAHASIAVPDSAVVEDDLTGEKRVALVDPTMRAHWTRVLLGAGLAGWHELKSPALRPGTNVVVEGQRGLPDRARVTFAP
ncbi:MAG: HlyD family efflux transporter periplasmic adaptor subunit [Candidatus Eisenbacteria bacterium]|uniref:HlyD family efflux transporter periplasmic adaptor subunit n=1 Tax=Eiseniibacteriota bacterium TaxID=2212470 RepID=A0A538T0V9_UNCEI|nr:MAG: HlyD family efflux transporter periplasmic adaptor subunit [Candidatus Eisenbacteria bacterium]